MVGGEHHRPVDRSEMFEPFDTRVGDGACEWHDPGCKGQAANQRDGPPSIPGRKIDCVMRLLRTSFLSNEPSQVVNAAGLCEARFVDRGLKSIFERHHQLDALERAQTGLLERRTSADFAAARKPSKESLERALASRCGWFRAGDNPVANGAAPQLSSPFRTGQVAVGPHRHASNPLVVGQNGVRLTHDVVRVCTRLEHEHGVNTFFGAIRHTDDGGVANTRELVERALDVLWEDVESLGRYDQFLLAPFDEQSTVAVALADVAGMQPSFGVDWRIGSDHCGVRSVVTARDVFPTNEDLAVFRNPYFDAGDWLSDGTLLPFPERMVECDDRCGFGQAVALKHHKTHPAPEFFEFRREWRGTYNEGPELEAERRVHSPVSPPSGGHRRAGRGRLRRFGYRPCHVLAQHVENLGDAHQ